MDFSELSHCVSYSWHSSLDIPIGDSTS